MSDPKITDEFFVRLCIDVDAKTTDAFNDWTHYSCINDAVNDSNPSGGYPEIVYRITPVKTIRAGDPVVETVTKTKLATGVED